jgi:hypothetical protein
MNIRDRRVLVTETDIILCPNKDNLLSHLKVLGDVCLPGAQLQTHLLSDLLTKPLQAR